MWLFCLLSQNMINTWLGCCWMVVKCWFWRIERFNLKFHTPQLISIHTFGFHSKRLIYGPGYYFGWTSKRRCVHSRGLQFCHQQPEGNGCGGDYEMFHIFDSAQICWLVWGSLRLIYFTQRMLCKTEWSRSCWERCWRSLNLFWWVV